MRSLNCGQKAPPGKEDTANNASSTLSLSISTKQIKCLDNELCWHKRCYYDCRSEHVAALTYRGWGLLDHTRTHTDTIPALYQRLAREATSLDKLVRILALFSSEAKDSTQCRPNISAGFFIFSPSPEEASSTTQRIRLRYQRTSIILVKLISACSLGSVSEYSLHAEGA